MAHPDSLNALRRRQGFSILELLMVVTLIGVLVAIGLPSYARYQDRTKSTQAVTDITGMAFLISRFADESRSFPPDLAAVGLANRLDPWGRPYVYYNVEANGRGGARKDHALNPLNTDFDLYSLGPDGQTKKQITQKDSIDDILRASNGKFVGIAADF